MSTTSLQNTLIAHAVGTSVFFAFVSLNYFKKYSYTTALQTQ